MSKALSRDDVLTAEDLAPRRVELPEWGGYAFIRVMTDEDRDGWEAWLMSRGDGEGRTAGMRRELVARALVDAKGRRLFDKADELRQKSAKVINRLFEEASELNGLGDKAVADAKKNSGETEQRSSATT